MSIEAESNRLLTYCYFDTDVLERVATVAEQQRASSWSEIQRGLPDTQVFAPQTGKPIEVLDIVPTDYEGVHVFHLPMGNGLDDNMRIGVATLAAAEPTKRFIAAGNPGAPGQNSGKLRLRDLSQVWGGDLRVTVDPLLQYLDKQGIAEAVHSGGSYGADRAATAAGFADRYDHHVPRAILMEPVSVVNRSLLGIARSFLQSAGPLEGYVEAAQSQPYVEARKHADEINHGLLGAVGLLRFTNIAITHALVQDGFEHRVRTAFRAQEDMRANIIWGSESELATHAAMLGVTKALAEKYGDRIQSTVLAGQKHAMNNDIFLQAALVLQSQKL